MALICDVELESGLTIQNAYLRISRFEGTEKNVNFNLRVYVDKASYEDEKLPVTQINYSMEFDKDRNLFRQMYEHLTSLSEYTNAVEA